MGLLDGLRGDPQKIEIRGDQALSGGEALRALQLYRDAERKFAKRGPEALERLRRKAAAARAAFIRAKLDEARQFLADEVGDAASEALEIAREHLTSDDTAVQREFDQVVSELEGFLVQRSPDRADLLEGHFEEAGGVSQSAETHSAAAGPGDLPDADAERSAAGWDETGGDHTLLFEQLATGLPADDRERGLELGRDFQEGFIAEQRGDTAAALAAFERAAEQHPDEPLVREHLALTLDQAGRTAEAADQYRQALAHKPQRRDARLALAGIIAGVDAAGGAHPAVLWLGQGRERPNTPESASAADEALELLAEGVRADEERAVHYWMAAADICLARGRATEAQSFAARALEAGSAGDPTVWQIYAVSLEMNGSLDEAEEAFHRAVRLGGASMFYRAEFAEFALRHSRALAEAEELILQTCLGCQASAPSSDQLDIYGILLTRIQFARGEFKSAIEGLDRVIAQGPARPLMQQLLRLRERILKQMRASGADLSGIALDPPVPEEDSSP